MLVILLLHPRRPKQQRMIKPFPILRRRQMSPFLIQRTTFFERLDHKRNRLLNVDSLNTRHGSSVAPSYGSLWAVGDASVQAPGNDIAMPTDLIRNLTVFLETEEELVDDAGLCGLKAY
jgi:hypothetical protein